MSFETLVERARAATVDAEYNERYNGKHHLDVVGLSVNPSIRFLEMNMNWDRLVVDTTAEVLTVDGFECSDASAEVLDQIWRDWSASQMSSKSYWAHVEALTQGRAFIVVGQDDSGRITTTVETGQGVAFEREDSGAVGEAVLVRSFRRENASGERFYYFTPQKVEVFEEIRGVRRRLRAQDVPGRVPIVPLTNAARIDDVDGRSEIDLVKTFTDAASRSFTLLQLATEILSMPQRYIAGGDMSKFKRADGTAPTLDDLYLGSFMFAPDANAKFGQFAGADLSKIISTIHTYAEQVSSLTGIPPSMMGVAPSQPASAEAMRAAKERMISRGERKQQIFGDAWEEWARLVALLRGYDVEPLESVATVWRDIAVPSVAARNATLLQAHAQGVISARTARSVLPLSPEQLREENAAGDEADEYGAGGEIIPGAQSSLSNDSAVTGANNVPEVN